MFGASPAGTEPILAVGFEQYENAVFKPAVKKSPDELLMFGALVRIETNADKIATDVNEIFGCEQTVLRGCVARSEHARDSVTLCRGHHKHDRPAAPFGLLQSRIPGGIPRDSRSADVEIRRTQVAWTWTLRRSDVGREKSDNRRDPSKQIGWSGTSAGEG